MKTKQPSTIFYHQTCPPQKHDRAPYGSLYSFTPDAHTKKLFIQVDPNPEDPVWLPVDEYLMDVFGPYFKDQSFIELTLKHYEKRALEGKFFSDLESLL